MKIELLHVKKSSKLTNMHSTGGVFVEFLNETDLTASKPDFLSILGNMLTISKITKIALAGKNNTNIINYIKKMVIVLISRSHTF